MKTYGTLRFGRRPHSPSQDHFWLIEADAHLRTRLRRMFLSANEQAGNLIYLSDSVTNAADLEMILHRYPMIMDPAVGERLRQRSEEFTARRDRCDHIINGNYDNTPIETILPLRHYQEQGVHIAMERRRLLCGDDLGLGKTAIGLGMFAAGAGRTIIVCQPHLQEQWAKEARKFLGDEVRIHTCAKVNPYPVPDHDIFIIPYSKVRGWSDHLQGTHGLVVFDEVQELRGEDTAKYKASRRIADATERVLGLSATPIYNYGDEAHTVFNAIEPGCLGTKEEFVREWCSSVNGKNIVKDPNALGDYLSSELGVFLRRRRAEVGMELPPMSTIVHPIDHNQARFAQTMSHQTQLAHAVLNSGTAQERGLATAQLDMFVRQQTGIAKAPHVADFVAEMVANGEKIILAGWHREVYEIWKAEFERMGIKHVLYTGSESTVQKRQAAEEFITGDAQVFIISLRSGAGLNDLETVANVIVVGEMDWSPRVHDQLGGRIRRGDQDQPTTMVFLVSAIGSDPEMAAVLGLKREQSEGIINPNLDSVFATSKEAVESHGRTMALGILQRAGRAHIPQSQPR